MKSITLKRLACASLCMALGFALPFFTGQIPEIGAKLSTMHIAIFLCGFLCGWKYGLVIGIVTPLLRSLLLTMPPIYPNALSMALELGCYGFLSGLLYRLFPKKTPYLYLSLGLSMLGGRLVWGLTRFVMLLVGKTDFSLSLFLSAAFLDGIPGILLHFALVPPAVIALKKAGLFFQKEEHSH